MLSVREKHCLSILYIQILACIICRSQHLLCTDVNMYYIQQGCTRNGTCRYFLFFSGTERNLWNGTDFVPATERNSWNGTVFFLEQNRNPGTERISFLERNGFFSRAGLAEPVGRAGHYLTLRIQEFTTEVITYYKLSNNNLICIYKSRTEL